jgi:Fe-S cluster assembly protein SufD
MTKTIDRDAYLTKLLASISPASHSVLQSLHAQAIGFLQEQKIPTTRDEEWRFTDLTPLLEWEFESASRDIPAIDLQDFNLPEAVNTRLVFVNGNYAANLSSVNNLPAGVSISSLKDANSESIEHLGKLPGGEEIFTALNTAGLRDLAIVRVGKNISIDPPIQILHLATSDKNIAIRSRCLVIMETGSNATLIEEYYSIGHATPAYFNNSVTEIYLADNARLNHTRIQQEDTNAIHIAKTAVSQSRDSHYTGNAIEIGAKLSRHNWQIFQTGVQTETILNGLTMVKGDRVADTHSAIILAHPHGKTDQLHKCIIDERARGVFNGKVFVPQAAQLTDAAQLNRNLLLSEQARVDTKPQLEIVADNVKCSHGATVSQLEDDEIFYLQSRGLDPVLSRGLLINAFAVEIVDRIPVDSVRKKLAAFVTTYRSN